MGTGIRLGLDVRSGQLRAAVAWPDGTVAVLPPTGNDDGDTVALFADVPPTAAASVPTVGDLGRFGVDPGPAAAALRQVAVQAEAIAGDLADVVTMAVPAGWGPRRLQRLREAAGRAGLGVVEVVAAPVAVCWHLLAGGVRLPVGSVTLVCEVDAGCVASVVRRTVAGFEVVSSVDAVTVAADMPVVDAATTRAGDASGGVAGPPVLEVARRAVDGAQHRPGAFALVCAVGARAGEAAVAAQLGAAGGAEPLLAAEMELAAVLGAVRCPVQGPGREVRPARSGGWRELGAVVVAGLWSVVLFGQFLAGAQRYGPREKLDAAGMLLAAWGGLAFAAVFGLVAAVGGVLLATAARHDALDAADDSGGVGWVRHRLLGVALAGGAVGGVLVAAVYALLAAGYFDLAPGPFVRWSVLPVLPGVVAVLGLGVVMWRRPDPPGGSWPGWLRFPTLVVWLAGFGALLVSFDETGSPWPLQPLAWLLQQWFPSGQDTIIGPVGRLGGLGIGAAAGLLLVRRPLHRLLVGVPLAALVAGSLAWRVTGAVAVGFACLVAGWWAARAVWLLLRPLLLRPPGSGPARDRVGDPAAAPDSNRDRDSGFTGAPSGGRGDGGRPRWGD